MGNIFRHNNQAATQENQYNLIKQIPQSHNPNKFEDQTLMHIYCKLRPQVTKNQVQKLSQNKPLLNLLENQTWVLNFQQQQINYPYLLSLIESCKGVKTIKIISIAYPTFYIHLINPHFHDLQKLVLARCKIENIDFLSYIDMPHLKQLCLNQNLLTSIKPLKKVMCKLRILNLRQNLLNNLWDSQIQLVNFDQDVDSLNFQENKKQYYGDDINWLFKMPFQTMIRLEIQGKLRIGTRMNKNKLIQRRFRGNLGFFHWGPRSPFDGN